MKFFGKERLASQKKNTQTGTNEAMRLSPSPEKMGPMTLPPVSPNPLKRTSVSAFFAPRGTVGLQEEVVIFILAM